MPAEKPQPQTFYDWVSMRHYMEDKYGFYMSGSISSQVLSFEDWIACAHDDLGQDSILTLSEYDDAEDENGLGLNHAILLLIIHEFGARLPGRSGREATFRYWW